MNKINNINWLEKSVDRNRLRERKRDGDVKENEPVRNGNFSRTKNSQIFQLNRMQQQTLFIIFVLLLLLFKEKTKSENVPESAC